MFKTIETEIGTYVVSNKRPLFLWMDIENNKVNEMCELIVEEMSKKEYPMFNLLYETVEKIKTNRFYDSKKHRAYIGLAIRYGHECEFIEMSFSAGFDLTEFSFNIAQSSLVKFELESYEKVLQKMYGKIEDYSHKILIQGLVYSVIHEEAQRVCKMITSQMRGML